jgi:hypothetical protein
MVGTKPRKKGDRRLKKNNPSAGQAAAKARAKLKAEESSKNPFEIKTDLAFNGLRGVAVGLMGLLKEQVEKLEAGNKTMSVLIPITVCPDRKSANNLMTQLRNYLRKENPESKATYTIRTIMDAENKYVNSRIWRTN